MNNLYFDNIIQIGDLYLEYVLFEFESEPILFLCSDIKHNIYLCLCSEIRYGQKWIVTKCKFEILELLINKNIDIVSAFLSSEKAIIIDRDIEGNEKSYEIDVGQVDKLDLPKEGTFVESDNTEIKKYFYKKELIKNKIYSYNNIRSDAIKYEMFTCAEMDTKILTESCIKLELKRYNDTVSEIYMKKNKYDILIKEIYINEENDLDINNLDSNNYLKAV